MRTSETNAHVIVYSLGRREWARTEWPAIVVWGGIAIVPLLGIAFATARSPWWALLLLLWWPLLGRKGTAIFLFLARGSRVKIAVRSDGAIFVSEGGSEPQYAHWVGFVDCGDTFLLWGGDGRYRLIIPKRALTAKDYAVLAEYTGVDLPKLLRGEEVRVRAIAK
jgi:hypothetical protein